MTVTLQIEGKTKLISTITNASIKHLWVLRNRAEERKLAIVHRKLAALPHMSKKRRKLTEQWLIDQNHCANCGSSLNDVANQLEGEALKYTCTYCK